MARAYAERASHLVQCRPSRWQSGAGRSHERGPEARVVPNSGELRLQGNRDRLPFGVEHRVCVQSTAHRGEPHPGRCDHSGLGAGPGRFDRADHRIVGRSQAGGHPLVQFHVASPAPGGLREKSGRDQGHRHSGSAVDSGTPAPVAGHGRAAAVFSGKFQRHRARFRLGDLRGGDVGVATDAAA